MSVLGLDYYELYHMDKYLMTFSLDIKSGLYI